MLQTVFLIIVFCFSNAFALTKIKFGLNWKAEPEFGGFYAAKELGYYEKAGLDVDIIEGAGGIPIAQMIASEKVDFGIVSGGEVIVARSNGADLVALFTVYQKSPQCIMVRKEAGIKDMTQLMESDFTLAAGSGTPWLTFLQKTYKPKKLKVVPYQGGISAFLNNPKLAQQCYVGSEPALAEAQGVKSTVLNIADFGFDNFAAVVATTNKALLAKPDLAKSFIEASRKGWESYLKDPTVAHKKIAQLNPAMDIKTSNQILAQQRPLMLGERSEKDPFGTMAKERWEKLNKQMHDLGLVRKPVATDSLFSNM